MKDIFKTTLLQPSHVVVPPRPNRDDFDYEFGGSDWVRACEEWDKKYKPTEVLKWRKFEDEKPKDKFYWKLDGKFNENCWSKNMVDFENFQKCNIPRIKKGRFTEWCYASEYEQAQQKEQLVGVLGDGWKRNEEVSTVFYNDREDLILFNIVRKNIEITYGGDAIKRATIPFELATIDVVIRLIENIENLNKQ